MSRPVKRLSKRAIAIRRKDVRWRARQLDIRYAPAMFDLLRALELSRAFATSQAYIDLKNELIRYGVTDSQQQKESDQ